MHLSPGRRHSMVRPTTNARTVVQTYKIQAMEGVSKTMLVVILASMVQYWIRKELRRRRCGD